MFKSIHAGDVATLQRLLADNPQESSGRPVPPGAGSVIVIIATDAPLLPAQCKALARRVPLGLARTGTTGSHFSGDLFLAFSTGNPGAITHGAGRAAYDQVRLVPWGFLDPFYAAVVQATEEAVANAQMAVMITNPSEDVREGLKAFREKRAPKFEGR